MKKKSYTAKQVRVIKAVIGSLKAVAAVSCHAIQFDKPTTKNKQRWLSMFASYHGTKDTVSQVKRVLKGDDRFKILWSRDESNEKKVTLDKAFLGYASSEELGNIVFKPGDNLLSLRNLKKSKVWSAKSNSTDQDAYLTGRNICEQFNRTAIAPAKKLVSLWKSEFPNGIPSGMNSYDCLTYILKMYYIEFDEKSKKILDNGIMKDDDEESMDSNDIEDCTNDDDDEEEGTNNEVEQDEEEEHTINEHSKAMTKEEYDEVVLPSLYFIQPFVWTFMLYGQYISSEEPELNTHPLVDPTATSSTVTVAVQRIIKAKEDENERLNDSTNERGMNATTALQFRHSAMSLDTARMSVQQNAIKMKLAACSQSIISLTNILVAAMQSGNQEMIQQYQQLLQEENSLKTAIILELNALNNDNANKNKEFDHIMSMNNHSNATTAATTTVSSSSASICSSLRKTPSTTDSKKASRQKRYNEDVFTPQQPEAVTTKNAEDLRSEHVDLTTTNVDDNETDNNNSINGEDPLVDFDDMINFKPITTSKKKVNKKSTAATTNKNSSSSSSSSSTHIISNKRARKNSS